MVWACTWQAEPTKVKQLLSWLSLAPDTPHHHTPALAYAPFLQMLHHHKKRRHKQHGEASRSKHAGEHRDADGFARAGAGAGGKHQRRDTENESERRHQDRAEPSARRLDGTSYDLHTLGEIGRASCRERV